MMRLVAASLITVYTHQWIFRVIAWLRNQDNAIAVLFGIFRKFSCRGPCYVPVRQFSILQVRCRHTRAKQV